jgi:hypothetical protein
MEVKIDADENSQYGSRNHAIYSADSGRAAPHGRVGRTSHPLKKEMLKSISDPDPKVAEPPGKPGESRLARS